MKLRTQALNTFICLTCLLFSTLSFSEIQKETFESILKDISPDETIRVASIGELRRHIKNIQPNNSKQILIVIEKGEYQVSRPIVVDKPRVAIVGASANPQDVILKGKGFKGSVVGIFDISNNHITLASMTLKDVANHLIQVRAEKSASYFKLTNSILLDAKEQLFKVSGGKSGKKSMAGKITFSYFGYSEGIGPQFYIGGIDAHASENWLIEGNTFENIASPSKQVAQYAIHFWRGSANTRVKNNTIKNCDRGIGFGLGKANIDHIGGVIENNTIINEGLSLHRFSDVGISLESSPNSKVINNTIELQSDYPNAIEYRFPATSNVLIKGNKTNKRITSRNGASGVESENDTSFNLFKESRYWFNKTKQKLSN